MWKDLFQDHILGRGVDYFIRNLVENVYVKDNIIEATVYGTEEYKVEIVKDNEEIIDLSCNCPYADGGNNCKHMAAVLFYLENKENTLVVQDIEESIGKLVEEADRIIIKDFLIDILKNNEKLLNRFKSRLQCDISPTDMKRLKVK
ncbi:TPA: SWIM zinc finger domain-containing protein [Streptococcus agalactiae]